MSEPNGRIGQNGAGPGAEDERIFGFDTWPSMLDSDPTRSPARGRCRSIRRRPYVFEDTDHAAELFALQRVREHLHTRIMNPTTAAFEERGCRTRAGRGRSGHFLGTGRAVHRADDATRPRRPDRLLERPLRRTYTQFDITLRRGASMSSSSTLPIRRISAGDSPQTRVLYGETIGNPQIGVLDIAAVAEIAHEAGVPLMIDNTFATPYSADRSNMAPTSSSTPPPSSSAGTAQPSAGSSSSPAAFLGQRELPWMTEPSPGYHGIRFYETFGEYGYLMKARVENLRDMGPRLSPFNAFLFLQGLETLPVRMERHTRNAEAVAAFLAAHPAVGWVNYRRCLIAPIAI